MIGFRSPYLTHSTSKLTNIIKHGYNVCRLKRNENQGRMACCNEKQKTKLTYSVIPLFRYSVFSGVPFMTPISLMVPIMKANYSEILTLNIDYYVQCAICSNQSIQKFSL